MSPKPESLRATPGCLFVTLSASVTALMLLLNGSLVMAIVTALVNNDVPFVSNEKFSQFLLFTIPVLMAIGQWIMIDYVRTRIIRKT